MKHSLWNRKLKSKIAQNIMAFTIAFQALHSSDFLCSFHGYANVRINVSYNHGQKCWDSYTVRTLFNTREIVAACY